MHLLLSIIVVGAAMAVAATSAVQYPPEQVHLALGMGPDSMAVAWSTMENLPQPTAGSYVQWGLSNASLDQSAVGETFLYFSNPSYNFSTHTATMTGLKPATKYYYRVGDAAYGWSKIFYFTSMVTPAVIGEHLPETHVIYGDLGAAYGFSLCNKCDKSEVCESCTPADQGVVSERDTATMLLHVGDFAYDFDSDGGKIGDQFMRNIEPIAAYVPYMVSIGNHEDGDQSLAQFTERFRHMPSNSGSVKSINGPAPNNWWFSWDAGMVHYVSVSTEVQANVFNNASMIKAQFEWLEQDLIAANKNRGNVPWILVNGHRSMYCSCDGDCNQEAQQQRDGPWLNGTYGFEKLFFDQGVDFFINGHEHDYERNWPTYQDKTDQSNTNPKATIYIITGSAGCKELHEPFVQKQPPRSAYRSNTFGYSRLIVHNASHAKWQQVQTDPTFFPAADYGRVIDDVWVVQPSHGPFSLADAPKTTPTVVKGTQFDHWAGTNSPEPLIRLPEGMTWRHNKEAQVKYPEFVNEFGDSVWEDMHKSELERGTHTNKDSN